MRSVPLLVAAASALFGMGCSSEKMGTITEWAKLGSDTLSRLPMNRNAEGDSGRNDNQNWAGGQQQQRQPRQSRQQQDAESANPDLGGQKAQGDQPQDQPQAAEQQMQQGEGQFAKANPAAANMKRICKHLPPGADKMLNRQPLPPKEFKKAPVKLVQPGADKMLNPQPLPPGPPDPDGLRKAPVLRGTSLQTQK